MDKFYRAKNPWYDGCSLERRTYEFVYEPAGEDDERRFNDLISRWKNEVWKQRHNLPMFVDQSMKTGVMFSRENDNLCVEFGMHPELRFICNDRRWFALPKKVTMALSSRKSASRKLGESNSFVVEAVAANNGRMLSPKRGYAKVFKHGLRKQGHHKTAVVVHAFLHLLARKAKQQGLLGSF